VLLPWCLAVSPIGCSSRRAAAAAGGREGAGAAERSCSARDQLALWPLLSAATQAAARLNTWSRAQRAERASVRTGTDRRAEDARATRLVVMAGPAGVAAPSFLWAYWLLPAFLGISAVCQIGCPGMLWCPGAGCYTAGLAGPSPAPAV
jgi:hypothetical protein